MPLSATPDQSRFFIFQHFTPQSHIIYQSLVPVLWYESPLRRRMGVLNTHILKLMARKDIFVTLLIHMGTECIVQAKYVK